MSKDPFQELVDELTALRRSIEHLARTSLDKDEAKTLNQAVLKAATMMAQATKDAPREIQDALQADRDQIAHIAIQAATKAAESTMADIRQDLTNERTRFSQAAGEARREAWRWFGGFSGYGWPLCSPQGPLSERWQRFGYKGAAMPVSLENIPASIAARRVVKT